MEDRNISSVSFDEPDERPRPAERRRRGPLLAGVVLGIVGAAAFGFAVGIVHPSPELALASFAGPRPGGPPTPAEAHEHAEFAVGFALHRIGATTEQQERVQQIVSDALDEALPLLEEHRAGREQLRTILSADTIDRQAIEKVRLGEVSLADRLSRIVANVIADSAEVLGAEQRAQLLERFDHFRHRR